MCPRSVVYHAAVYDESTEAASEPLLDDEPEEQLEEPQQLHHQQQPCYADGPDFRKFKMTSFLLGLMIGFFIQFSSLGANFLCISMWGEDLIIKSKKANVVIFSLFWSFVTSAMAIIILGFLRRIVSIAYSSLGGTSKQSEEFLKELIFSLESHFVVGAIVGVCIAWTLTDLLLGMKAQILHSFITMFVALLWFGFVLKWFSAKKIETHDVQQV